MKTVAEITEHLRRHNAYLVIAVTLECAAFCDAKNAGGVRGKVNLGRMCGIGGRNCYAARPVESAVRLGLLHEHRDGAAYTYTITTIGRQVLAAL